MILLRLRVDQYGSLGFFSFQTGIFIAYLVLLVHPDDRGGKDEADDVQVFQQRSGPVVAFIQAPPSDILIKRLTPPPTKGKASPPPNAPLMVPRVVGTERKGQPGATISQTHFEMRRGGAACTVVQQHGHFFDHPPLFNASQFGYFALFPATLP